MKSVYLENPYLEDESAFWLRGNLHTHSTRSDGKDAPQDMVRRYAELGYDFLMLSDHDVWGRPEDLDPCGLVLLRGAEICAGRPHVLCVGGKSMAAARDDHQGLLNDITRRGGLAILCHPNWEDDFNHYPYEVLAMLDNYAGIEIFNGVCIDLTGSHMATDKWDRLLGRGRKVWGYGNDDAHRISQTGRVANVVRVRQRTARAVEKALRTGSFYVSSGVRIESIRCEGPVLRLRAPDADQIAVFGNLGTRLGIFDGPELTFDVSEVASPSIRIECYGRGDRTAWTQPFFIRNGAFEVMQRRLAELGARAKSKLKAYRARREVKMTGKLTDPLWAKAPAFGRFLEIRSADPAPVRTEVRCIVTGKTLYFGIRCQEPLLEKLKLTPMTKGQPGLWNDDSVEIFIDLEHKGLSAYQLVINADGHAVGMGKSGLMARPKVTGKAGRWQDGEDRGWSVELALPLAQLGFKPAKGAKVGLHFCRNRHPVSGCYVWSWVGTSNHNLERYGTLTL
jgi:hypothetical protein